MKILKVELVTIKCLYCGRDKTDYPSRVGRFCSRTCAGKYQREVELGKSYGEFDFDRNLLERLYWKENKTFREIALELNCGTSHLYRLFRKLEIPRRIGSFQKGEKHPNWKGGLISRVCIICKDGFLARRNQVANGGGIVCSIDCWFEYNRGENHFRYDENTERLYPLEWTKLLRDKIRERDNWICAICERPGLDVHHIDHNKDNCDVDNLITLCTSCHMQYHVKENIYKQFELWSIFKSDLSGI